MEENDNSVDDVAGEESAEDALMREALSDVEGDAASEEWNDDELASAEDGDSPEELKAKLEKNSHFLNQRSKALKRMKDEIAELKQGSGGGLNKEDLAEVLAAAKQPAAEAEAVVEEFSFEGLQAKIDDGEETIEGAFTKLVEAQDAKAARREQMMVDLLKARDAHYAAEKAQGQMESLDPSIIKVATAFKQSGNYEGFSEQQLIKLAQMKLTDGSGKVVRRPANVSTASRSTTQTAAQAEETKKQQYLKDLGYTS